MQLFESVSGTGLDPGIEFVETVRKLLHATDGDPTALDELGDLLTNDVGSDRVRAIVDDALKLRLRHFSARLDERFKGSQWLRLLLTPIGQLPYDTLEWSWNPPASNAPDDKDDREGMRLRIGAPLGHGAVVGRTPENDLQYRFDVMLGSAGRLATPFRFRNAPGDPHGGRARAQLECRFEHPSQVLLLDALANDLPRLEHVLEPERLPDSNLKSIEFALQGQVLLGASLSAGTSWSTLRNPDGEALAAPRSIAAQIRCELEWACPGHFKLQIRPNALHGTVIATLISVDGAEPARVLTLGGNLTIDGLERVVRPLLTEHGGAPPDLIDLADRYSRPRELMQDHLEQTLNEHPTLAQELRGVLLAGNAAGDMTRKFAEHVSMDALALLDEHETVWHELLQGECASAVELVLARLDVATALHRFARAVLRQWIGQASEALGRSLHEELEQVLEEDEESVRMLGGGSATHDESLQARQLLGPCVDFIARVRRVRQQILRATEAGIAEEFGLELARAVQRARHENVLLELTLNPRHEAVRDIYEQMLRGDFREALTLAVDSGQPHIALERGLLAEALTREHATGLCFDIIDPGSLDLLQGKLVVEHQVGGSVRICSDAIASDASGSAIAMPAALMLAAGERPTTALAVALGRHRGTLRQSEVQRHLNVLETAGLLAAGTTSAMALSLGEIDDLKGLRADVLLSLSRTELERVRARDRRDVERVSVEEQMRIIDTCFPHLRPVLMLLDDAQAGDGVAFVQSQIGVSLQRVRETVAGKASFAHTARLAPLVALVHALATNAERMVRFLESLDALSALELGSVRPGSAIDEKHVVELEAARVEITALLTQWAGSGAAVLDDDDAMLWNYGFVTCLRHLAGIDRAVHPLMPAISWHEHGSAHCKLVI